MVKCPPGTPIKSTKIIFTHDIKAGDVYITWDGNLWCVYRKTETTKRLMGRYKWPTTAVFHASKAP